MRVLVVEDSPRMARVLRKGLQEEGFSVEAAADGLAGLRLAEGGDFDVVLLDVNLPGLDGFSFLKRLRVKRSDVPVMMVTARDGVEDRVEGLDAGADDYLVKPFKFEELLARMRAVMRRPGTREEPVLEYGGLRLDPASGRVERGGEPVSLSAREFSLLRMLLANPDRILSRSRLYESVWGVEYDGVSNVLEVYVNYLRRKLEAGKGKRVIHTVRGRGYLLGKEP